MAMRRNRNGGLSVRGGGGWAVVLAAGLSLGVGGAHAQDAMQKLKDKAKETAKQAEKAAQDATAKTEAGVREAVEAVWPSRGQPVYPAAARGETVDDYHGTKVADPYRWLEDIDSTETRAWVDGQVALVDAYLKTVPQRDAIEKRLTQLWNYEKYGLPMQRGGKYFFTKNDGLQNQAVLYVADGLNSEPRVLIDPNTLSKDGTVALAGTALTDDGKLMAYNIADAGSDWNIIKVRDVATGKDLPDEIRWVKFSGASWLKDGSGFYYARFDEPKGENKLKSANENQKVYFHKLGTPQSADVLVYERPDQPKWYFGAGVSDDGKYLILGISDFAKIENAVYYREIAPASPGTGEFKPLAAEFDAQYSVIDNDGPVFLVQTDKDAPRGRVVAIDSRKTEPANWVEVIPQTDYALQGTSLVGDQMFANYLQDAKTLVRVHDVKGKHLKDVAFEGIGSAGGFGGRRSDTETFYSFSSYNRPPTIYRYDVKTGKSEVYREPKVAIDPAKYETEQKFYTSKDGTKVPVFIVHKKGLKLDGTNPTLLYGYGGFNIPLTPGFSPATVLWLDMGGVYAVANIRGGGEYGEEWHKAGTRLKKQNVFDDFIGAAEYLIKEGYTKPEKLAIHGGSNGGLLVGAVLNQRPELFGAAVPAVGVMDMLRFHKFTIGAAWTADYGNSENAEEFAALKAYSPLHTIKEGVCYPPVMVTTADHDDRVYPAHSFKYAAALQHAQAQNKDCANPILIRIETRAGHGAGKPTSKRIEELADMYAFLVKSLKMSPKVD